MSIRLLASYFAAALIGLLAAAAALVVAAPDLAAGAPLASAPVLAVHLFALGFLPLAVTGAALHLLPFMFRNDLRGKGRLWLALPLLAGGGWLAAPGVAFTLKALLWVGAALLTVGFAVVVVELGGLVARAPRGRTLVASRTGVSLSLFHAVCALVLGAIVFAHGDARVLTVVHGRWLLIHLHLAVLGWLTLLILTVGRTLAPMLALAPAAEPRRIPLAELTLAVGLWLLAAGIATSQALAFAGAGLIVLALGRFAALMVRVARTRRIEFEGPLLHLLAGAVFLVQAAALGLLLLAGLAHHQRALAGYVVFLLLGWGVGVTLGHLPKLLSLSIWVWWPPGPRPKQSALYPRRLGQAEAALFAAGVETLALSVVLGSGEAARGGAGLVAGSAVLAALTATQVWRRRHPDVIAQRDHSTRAPFRAPAT